MKLVVTRPTTGVVLLLLSASLGAAAAQPPEKVPRVGYLNPGSLSDPVSQRRLEAFRCACGSSGGRRAGLGA
jgi:hypothetical protein